MSNSIIRAPRGYVQGATLTSAVTLASLCPGAAIPTGATRAILVAEAQDVRWRDDGTAPTATVGMLLEAKKPYEFIGDLNALQFIETTASAKINVALY